MSKIEPPRIGTGKGYFIAGAILILLGLFISMAGSTLDPGPSALGGFIAIVGASCIAVGFWVKLFGALERRLIDIQRTVTSPSEAPAPQAAAPIVHREPHREPLAAAKPTVRPSDLEARSGS
jgi:hypothetical protein